MLQLGIFYCVCMLIGWDTAEMAGTKVIPLWVGARGVESVDQFSECSCCQYKPGVFVHHG